MSTLKNYETRSIWFWRIAQYEVDHLRKPENLFNVIGQGLIVISICTRYKYYLRLFVAIYREAVDGDLCNKILKQS